MATFSIPTSNWSLNRFLKALASTDAAPGGGAAAALSAATGCATGLMVGRFILKRSGLSAAQRKRVGAIVGRLSRQLNHWGHWIEAEPQAYQRLVQTVAARARGKATASQLQRAQKQAIGLPLVMVEAAFLTQKDLKQLLPDAGRILASDVRAAQKLLHGASGALIEMVKINLIDLPKQSALARITKRRLASFNQRSTTV